MPFTEPTCEKGLTKRRGNERFAVVFALNAGQFLFKRLMTVHRDRLTLFVEGKESRTET
jgi:hypothetical protein